MSDLTKWSYEDIKNHFDSVSLPDTPIKLDCCSTIVDCKKFVKSHLDFLKDKDSNMTYYPYVQRLRKLAKIIKLQNE